MKNDFFGSLVLNFPRVLKRVIVLSTDIILCLVTVWFAYYLRLGEFINPFNNQTPFNTSLPVLASVLMALPIFVTSGLYRLIFRYSSWDALMTIVLSSAKYLFVYSFLFTIIGVEGVPRTIGIIQPILLLLSVGASRAFARFWLGGQYRYILHLQSFSNVMIYGAGKAGRELAAALMASREVRLVGFLDDNTQLHKHIINGTTVFNPKDMNELIKDFNITAVFLALPSCSRKRRNEILDRLIRHQIHVNTVPSITEIAQGKVSVSDVRELDLDDLLGRDPVVPDHTLISKNIKDKTILVSGAGGSIGSELCRQICDLSPRNILLVEQSEYALYKIHQELSDACIVDKKNIFPILASVRDEEHMSKIMLKWRPDTIYHAAAYKHVPLVEYNPAEGIMNNVFGTVALARASISAGVKNFILISTDKAVRPTNIMGASKRIAELYLQAIASTNSSTKFSMVRFGNVLGSSGSVVPKFRQQIKVGGPITITDERVTRYFMTITEASQLVIQAGAMAEGGDVFVLNMGQPVRIIDLAKRMIELSGLTIRDSLNPDGDIQIDVIGLRPGEKLYEELLIGDNPQPTTHPLIMKAHENFILKDTLEFLLIDLKEALLNSDVSQVREVIMKLVPEYIPDSIIVDWHHNSVVEN